MKRPLFNILAFVSLLLLFGVYLEFMGDGALIVIVSPPTEWSKFAPNKGRPYPGRVQIIAAGEASKARYPFDYLFRVPFPQLPLVLATPVVLRILLLIWDSIQSSKRNRRLLSGGCEVCGYDLRATPERCPECEAVPKAIA